MHCGLEEPVEFLALTGISVDGKNHYYLCKECAKDWEILRITHIGSLYDKYHAGLVLYKVYQAAFNKLMEEFLISGKEKVVLT
jgi:hypothetical protein